MVLAPTPNTSHLPASQAVRHALPENAIPRDETLALRIVAVDIVRRLGVRLLRALLSLVVVGDGDGGGRRTARSRGRNGRRLVLQ